MFFLQEKSLEKEETVVWNLSDEKLKNQVDQPYDQVDQPYDHTTIRVFIRAPQKKSWSSCETNVLNRGGVKCC